MWGPRIFQLHPSRHNKADDECDLSPEIDLAGGGECCILLVVEDNRILGKHR